MYSYSYLPVGSVSEGLAASAHVFQHIRSVYRRRGDVIERTEGRMSLHTRTELIPAIVERVKSVHPHEVPGISARPIIDGNPEYLRWMAAEQTLTRGGISNAP